jgi:hypothetical protein
MRLCTGKNYDYLGNTPSLNLHRYSISEFCNVLAMSMTIFVGNDLIETKSKVSIKLCTLLRERKGRHMFCVYINIYIYSFI